MVPNHAPAFVYSGKTEADNPTLKFIWNLLNILTIRKIKFEIMGQTKLISCRISGETLERIDKLVHVNGWRNRSVVINTILDVVTQCASETTLRNMLRTYDPYSSGYTIKFEKKDQTIIPNLNY